MRFISAALSGGVALVVATPIAVVVLAAGSGSTSSCAAATSAASAPVVGQYGPSQVQIAGQIVAAGQSLGVNVRGQTLAVMVGIGESGLANLEQGDAVGPDSRGVFQQRANGAWGSYEERMTPSIAAASFYRALLSVAGWEAMEPTAAAHAVQRNADPGYYTKFWPDAVRLLSTITNDPNLAATLAASGGQCPSNGPADQAHGAVVALASTFTGTPYLWGGSEPGGFDCSGLTSYVYVTAAGLTIPRTSQAQQATAMPVTDPQPGDLVFFGRPAGHVGIVVDPAAGTMIDAPNTGAVVRLEPYKGWPSLAGFGRFA